MSPSPLTSVARVVAPPPPHWVGDGTHVRSIFACDTDAEAAAPDPTPTPPAIRAPIHAALKRAGRQDRRAE